MSCTMVNAPVPKLDAQHPKNDTPLCAPALGTITPVLHSVSSQETVAEAASTELAEHDVKKLQGPDVPQHCANEPLRDSVAGKSQLRRSETACLVSAYLYHVDMHGM